MGRLPPEGGSHASRAAQWLPSSGGRHSPPQTRGWKAALFCYDCGVKDRILRKFGDEIAQLERELKTELPKEIKRARELGDLRENAEYQAAKERQRLVEARISQLAKRVSEISLMNLDRIPHGKVGFGSTVHLKDESGQTIVYRLVMPEDANADAGLISTASPIGRSLLNKEEGDEVVVKTPNGGERHFLVVKLVTIHDE
ncbi:MAG: transcription elongation factor GreA [Acidobacteria bacterium]|nr:MAG: transcription elongation factor GreA [Acidobacteriota bacterium]